MIVLKVLLIAAVFTAFVVWVYKLLDTPTPPKKFNDVYQKELDNIRKKKENKV